MFFTSQAKCIVVAVDNVKNFGIDETLRPCCIPLFPTYISETLSIGDAIVGTKRKRGALAPFPKP